MDFHPIVYTVIIMNRRVRDQFEVDNKVTIYFREQTTVWYRQNEKLLPTINQPEC